MFGHLFLNRPMLTPERLADAPFWAMPSGGEYLSTHTAQAFDRTIPGRVLEEQAILDAEKAEGTYDPDYLPQREARDMFGSFPDMPELRHAHAIPEDEWKASPYYRKGVQYRPDMTATRARILSENYDERRFREELIANGDAAYGPGVKAAAFGAMLLGSLPDPVNVLPLGGGVRAASLLGKAGLKAAIGAGAKAGIVEGAAGALLSDALTLPDLAARGEDVGFVDVMLDTAFGASLGGGLGALGGGIGGYLGKRRAQAQELLAERALLRHAELLREADVREKAALAVTTEFGALDNNFLNSGWHAFEDNPDDFFLSRVGRDGGPGASLATRAETFFGLLDDVDLGIARRDRWRIWTAEFQKQLEDAGFSSQKAESFSDVLGAHAEVMAPMYGMEPGRWLEHRLAGFRQMSPEEFAAVREGFLYDAPGREAADLRQATGEGRGANPIADAVWGQLDRAAIREGYGQDVVRAIEERYGRGVFAKTSGGKAKDRATLSNDGLASELSRRGLLPEGSSLDDMVNYLATGEGVDTGRALYQPADMVRPLPQRFADMPTLEADSSHWFGKGKEIEADKKNLRKNLKEWAKENFSRDTAASNADTGWEVQVTAKGVKNSLAHGFNATLARSVPFIPQIIEGGIHVDSIRKTPRLMSHIFANKIKLDGQDYVVGFVVREDANGNRFYDHELTEIIDPGLHNHAELPEGMGGQWERANRGDVMNILREKLGVNDGSGRILFHAADGDPANARGAIVFRPEDGQALIALFKGKRDISTVIHEGAGHFFLENLRDAAQQPNAPAWVREGWRDVAKAIGADADAAKTVPVDAHEKFARMIVDYFRRGEAPTPILTTTFQRFARWLTRIYRALTRQGDLEGISPEVARTMDRMLATEDDLRAREINRRVDSARNDDADLLRAGLAGREKRDIMRAQEKALADMSAGRPVDVGPVLRESQAPDKAGNLMRDFPLDGQPASEATGSAVNYAVETADDFPPAPERARGEAAEAADAQNQAAVDADVEARLSDLEAQGKLDAEDAAHLAEAADRQARAANYGEWGQSVLECVWGIA